jgi:uncharacterized protein with PIN domain
MSPTEIIFRLNEAAIACEQHSVTCIRERAFEAAREFEQLRKELEAAASAINLGAVDVSKAEFHAYGRPENA